MKSWHFFAVLCLGVLYCGTVGVQAGNGTGENIGSTAWNMEEDTQYEYASNCGVVWTPASTTPSEIAFIPTVTLGSVEDALFTRGATLAMDWDPEGTPLSASYNTKRVGVTGIQSTSWESVVNGAVLDNNPEECGGGKRIYPETDLSGTLKNTVNVRVTLENAIPEGMTGSLRLMVLDPMNQCKDGNNQSVGSFSSWQHDSWQCDNYGSYSLTNHLYFAEETISNTALLTITQANPGDNYIVVAAPDDNLYEHAFIYIAVNSTTDYKTPYFLTSDGSSPVPEEQKTELLTVWRTLHLEVDRIARPESASIETPNDILAEIVCDDWFIEEISRSCIGINLPTNTKTTISAVDNIIIIGDNMDPEVVSLCEVQRDYISTNSFWAIQVIRAWEIDSYYGYSINNNQVFVAATKCYSIYNEDDLTESQLRDIYRYVLLHELLHSFNISHDNSGIMSSAFAINNVLSISGRRLTNEHIRSIQQMVEPN